MSPEALLMCSGTLLQRQEYAVEEPEDEEDNEEGDEEETASEISDAEEGAQEKPGDDAPVTGARSILRWFGFGRGQVHSQLILRTLIVLRGTPDNGKSARLTPLSAQSGHVHACLMHDWSKA